MLSRTFIPSFPRAAAPLALAASLVLLPAVSAVAQQSSLREAVSRDSEVIKDLVYNAQDRTPASQRQPYEMSLLDAVEMALRNNLQVQVARYSPESSFQGITAQRGAFDTNLSFTIPQNYQRGTSPTTVQTAGADVITSQNLSGGFTWQENLEWGTSYRLSWNSNRSSTNNEFSTFNPSFASGLSANITQQLLQGFGDINRTGIRIAMNSYDQSLESFRLSVQEVIAQTVQAYWNVRAQAEAVIVQQQALDIAEQQLQRNQIQVQIGTLAPIETVQAETSVAGNKLSLIQQQNQLENAQDALKELLNFESLVDDPFAYDIVAVEEPEQTVPAIDVDDAIRIALENDPTLNQQRLGLRTAALRLDQARDNLRPSLAVTGSFNLQGRGGTRIIRGGLGGEETEVIETGFGTALSQLFSGDFNTWSVGATLSFPLHNYSAKASAAQAQIGERQALTQFEQRRQQVSYDVRQQVRNVLNLVQQVETATERRELADRQLAAEQRKFEVGTSTNFTVLTFQNQFSSAQLSELQAIIQLQTAIATLEQTKGTLLQYFGVQIGDAGTAAGR